MITQVNCYDKNFVVVVVVIIVLLIYLCNIYLLAVL